MQCPNGITGPIFGISRRYLPAGHPLRRRIATPYEYAAPEPEPAPELKDTAYVKYAATQARFRNLKHFLGQKGDPMFSDLCTFVHENMNVPDWAHNLARCLTWVHGFLVGPNGDGFSSVQAKKSTKKTETAQRAHAQAHSIFPEMWPDRPIYLDVATSNLLLGSCKP